MTTLIDSDNIYVTNMCDKLDSMKEELFRLMEDNDDIDDVTENKLCDYIEEETIKWKKILNNSKDNMLEFNLTMCEMFISQCKISTVVALL